MDDIIELTVTLPTGAQVAVKGREAWTLDILLKAGPAGVSVMERPAPRWSCYVHRLRKRGLEIGTIREAHGGAYAGRHGRYVLRVPLAVVSAAFGKGASHVE